jgi:putative MATE family efflux protein
MPDENAAKLTRGPILPAIFKMAVPMVFALVSMLLFNLTDTYFVAQLGKNQLAALTFTFPVVLFFVSLALGIGTGTSALVSRAIGEGNREKVQRFTTDSLILIFIISLFVVSLGLVTIEPLFSFFGAEGQILAYVKEYMVIWYIGVIFVMIPMVGNNAIRATGDTKTPSLIMGVAVVVNVILDPIFIFGWGPVPAMGIKGAAWATLISRATTLVAALHILGSREKMISYKLPALKIMFNSFTQVLKIGIPTALTRILFPIGTGVITKMVAVHGVAAVAAFGIGTRIEALAIAPLMALSSVVGPFVGQNAGANSYSRIKTAVKGSNKFVFLYGFILWGIISLFAEQLITIFNKEAEVIEIGKYYLWISTSALAFIGLHMLSATVLNVLRRPVKSGVISITQMFVLYIPLAWLLADYSGLHGIFWAGVISYLIVSYIATLITFKEIKIQRDIYE